MVQFSKLRLNGFKSFADATDLDISDGLNGVVGPNGCGKSNLVEALRWVMGETSAKKMRGSGMEDVIFAGSSTRTAKNRAEVTLVLKNPYRDAPAPFENLDEIEITRTIERNNGSTYRVNGKAVRARDVQMLFADIVSGANSPALVSQGRVTMMINAKPAERRQVLEESAGVAGLYARRHEAELRLKAAENNLLRLDDIMAGVESRYETLQKQVRQANRYKNLSQTIRDLGGLIIYLEWKEATDQCKDLETKHVEIEVTITELMRIIADLSTKETEIAAQLPDLKEEDSKIAAQLQTYLIEKQRCEDALKRIDDDIAKAKQTLSQSTQDREHEKEFIDSLLTSLQMREAELSRLQETSLNKETLETKLAERDALKEKLTQVEVEYEATRTALSQSAAERETLERRVNDYTSQLETQKQNLIRAEEELAQAKEGGENLEEIKTIKAEIEQTEALIENAKEELENIDAQKEAVDQEVQSLEAMWHEDNTVKQKIISEINVLENFLKSKDEEGKIAVVENIKPQKGYEIALAKAMGDTLLAALEDPEANQYWQALSYTPEELPELSAILEPLSSKVTAPEALSICLSQIGVVGDETLDVQTILKALKPGQMAVTKQGDVYRWDGYVITARSQSATAMHLERKNRHETLNSELETITGKVDALAERLNAEKEKRATVTSLRNDKNNEIRELNNTLTQNRNHYENLLSKNDTQRQTLIRLEERINNLKSDIERSETALSEATTALEGFDDTDTRTKEEKSEKLKSDLLEKRQTLSELNRECDRISYEIETRANRIEVLTADIEEARNRLATGKARISELESRYSEAEKQIEALEAKPEDLKESLESHLSKIADLETQRKTTSEAVRSVEEQTRLFATQIKENETKLSAQKEQRASIAAHMSSYKEKEQKALMQMESEGFETPSSLWTSLEWPEDKALPTLDSVREKFERSKRERENMGAVNLMAAEEAENTAGEIETMIKEREDLVEAISKLRQAIQKLNKEARVRMVDAFDKVNEHFKRLFTQLFNGGEAHLELTESDDILESGLEIFASPPGKKLQNLTLLSGGEQTLASIALIFAMFLTKPAPICVLDEIDAPLDDANVDRVCTMIEEIGKITGTRFMIITHHRMTMARMDRLYGVTMAERGISQLVSVDLQQKLFDDLVAA